MSCNEYQTPPRILGLVGRVLGDNFLDPCPINHLWDGLDEHWEGAVYVNPPGPSRESIRWWLKLLEEAARGNVSHGIYCAFHPHQLFYSAAAGAPMANYPVCWLEKRVAFLRPVVSLLDEDLRWNFEQAVKEDRQPASHSCLVYVPGRVDRSALFESVMSSSGRVTRGAMTKPIKIDGYTIEFIRDIMNRTEKAAAALESSVIHASVVTKTIRGSLEECKKELQRIANIEAKRDADSRQGKLF